MSSEKNRAKREQAESAYRLIVERLRMALQEIAACNDAQFVDASGESKPGAPDVVFRLVPSESRAATVEVMPDNACSTYVAVGIGGEVEVFTSPKDPERGVADALEIVDAVISGRVKERVARAKKPGEEDSTALYVQWKAGGGWRRIGPSGLGKEIVEYAPYRDSGAGKSSTT